jgi:hypothetical protein
MSILSIFKKLRGKWRLPTYTIQWYPSGRSCASGAKRKLSNLLPLMVRRAEWRR